MLLEIGQIFLKKLIIRLMLNNRLLSLFYLLLLITRRIIILGKGQICLQIKTKRLIYMVSLSLCRSCLLPSKRLITRLIVGLKATSFLLFRAHIGCKVVQIKGKSNIFFELEEFYSHTMDTILSIEDIHEKAKKQLNKNAYDYYASGARDENTLRDNVDSYRKIKIIPRCLVGNLDNINMSISLFGDHLDFPILVSPTAMHKLGHKGLIYIPF